MFKHILVPVDGSPTAQLAVAKAIGLARAFGSRITAIYVINPYPFTGVGTDFAYGQAEYLSAAQAEAKAALKQTSDYTGPVGRGFSRFVAMTRFGRRQAQPSPAALANPLLPSLTNSTYQLTR